MSDNRRQRVNLVEQISRLEEFISDSAPAKSNGFLFEADPNEIWYL